MSGSLLSKSPALTTGLDPFILSFLRLKVLSFREQLRFSWTEIPLVQFFFQRGGDVVCTFQVLRGGHWNQAVRCWGAPGSPVQLPPHGQASQTFGTYSYTVGERRGH